MDATAPARVGSGQSGGRGSVVTPTWFGPDERPLFGCWHLPPGGQARGVVVLAPAMARERLAADYTWRLLAATLVEQGVAVLRFDWTGTGDSAGAATDPCLVSQWRKDVAVAVATARSATSAPVVLLGHRLGATLVADVVRTDARARADAAVDGVVLWDPVPSGRRYLRELAAQQRLAVPAEVPHEDGWAAVPGDDMSTATAEAVRRLDLAPAEPLPDAPALVLARAGSETMLEGLIAGSAAGTIRTVPEQPALLDLEPLRARPAMECVDAVVSWCRAVLPQRLQIVEPSIRLRVELGARQGPNPVGERLTRLTDHEIFAIVAEPAAQQPGGTVVLLSGGVESHAGPARMWVDLARAWAEQGLRVVRCDLPGLGESPARPGLAAHSVYEPSAIADVEALLRELEPDDPAEITLVGMCSGAYHMLEAAARLRQRHLVLLAFGWWLVPAEFHRGSRIDPARRCYRSALRALRPMLLAERGRRLLTDHPETLWRTGTRLRLTAPLRPFRELVRSGSRVTLVLGDTDFAHFAPLARQLERLGRAASRRGFRLHVVPQLDHGLLSGPPRRAVGRLVFERVLAETSRPDAGPPSRVRDVENPPMHAPAPA